MTNTTPKNISFLEKVENYHFIALMAFCITAPWSLALAQITYGFAILFSLSFIFIKKVPLKAFLTPLNKAIAIYLAIQVIATIYSPSFSTSFRAFYKTDWVLFSLFFIVFPTHSLEKNMKLIKILLISGAIVSVYGIIQMFTGVEIYRGKSLSPYGDFYRSTGGYSLPLSFAGNLLMFFGLTFSLLFLEKTQKMKVLYGGISILLLGGLLASQTRSAWIGLIVLLVLGSILINRKAFYFTVIGMIVGVALIFLLPDSIQTRFVSIFDPSKNSIRLGLWKSTLNMIYDHWLIGVGPGFFTPMLEPYKIPGVVYSVPGMYDATVHAHNDYLGITAQSGIFGLISWLSIWVIYLWKTLQNFHSKVTSSTEKKIYLGTIISVVAIMMAAFFQSYYEDLVNNLIWCFMIILGTYASKNSMTNKTDG